MSILKYFGFLVKFLKNPVQCVNRVNFLEKENASLRQLAYEKVSETNIVDFFVKDHFGLLVTIEGGFCRVIAELLVKEFIETGAANYVEMSFTSNNCMPGEHFVLTLQKSSGLTPHQKIKMLEKELSEERSWKNW